MTLNRWTDNEASRLIDFVSTNKSEAADGLTFKKPFWVRCAVYVSSGSAPGKAKSWRSCSEKFNKLKGEFHLVKGLKELSGIHWDEKKGFNIGASCTRSQGTALDVFQDFVKSHPKASKFKKAGFPLYEAMFDLMPSRARGANVFHPSQTNFTPMPASINLASTSTTDFASTHNNDLGSPEPDPGSPIGSDTEDEPLGTQEWLHSPIVPHKRKVSALDAFATPVTTPPVRKGRVAPILELSNKLGELTDVYRQSKVTPTTSTSLLTPRRQRAIEGVEADSSLDLMEKVSLLNTFMQSETAVGIYSALPEGSEIRTAWAKDQLRQAANRG